jgi:CRISPR-associated protein Cmr4
MIKSIVYLYLIAPLHTGGTTQEGNLLGIARESHTDFPYIPSSTIRGRLRSSEKNWVKQIQLFGPELKDIKDRAEEYKQATGKNLTQLEQGAAWVGDASILWLPVPSLSHGVIWISCPLLLQRWARYYKLGGEIPNPYSTSLSVNRPIYLKDAILKRNSEITEINLQTLPEASWKRFIPQVTETKSITRVLVLPDQHCATLIQMSLWRQVKVKLNEHKAVEGGFRYEEAIPPDTLMYFPWGITAQANANHDQSDADFQNLLEANSILQLGGQESLGRGFVQQWISDEMLS